MFANLYYFNHSGDRGPHVGQPWPKETHEHRQAQQSNSRTTIKYGTSENCKKNADEFSTTSDLRMSVLVVCLCSPKPVCNVTQHMYVRTVAYCLVLDICAPEAIFNRSQGPAHKAAEHIRNTAR